MIIMTSFITKMTSSILFLHKQRARETLEQWYGISEPQIVAATRVNIRRALHRVCVCVCACVWSSYVLLTVREGIRRWLFGHLQQLQFTYQTTTSEVVGHTCTLIICISVELHVMMYSRWMLLWGHCRFSVTRISTCTCTWSCSCNFFAAELRVQAIEAVAWFIIFWAIKAVDYNLLKLIITF